MNKELYFTVTNIQPSWESMGFDLDPDDYPYANGEYHLLEDGRLYGADNRIKDTERVLTTWSIKDPEILKKSLDDIEEQILEDFLDMDGMLYRNYGFLQNDCEPLRVEFLPKVDEEDIYNNPYKDFRVVKYAYKEDE